MIIEEATKEERMAVRDLMLSAIQSAQAECGMQNDDPFAMSIRRAAEALPELGDEFYRVNAEVKGAAEILLRVVKVSPNASGSATPNPEGHHGS
jgi:hypothetical protein